ncbi:MAG: DUF2497 domain-containing protein [Alphaproteobacteria bacterium]
MTDQNAQQQEPSMEEILASIRRIISEDGEEGEKPQPKPAEVQAAPVDDEPESDAESAADEEPDVLELTEVVEAPEPVAARAAAPEPARARPSPRLVDDAPLSADEAALVSETVVNRTQASLAELVAAMGATAPVGGRDTTVVDIVKTLLRPLLKDWLDQHLAGMVDEIVREEIERVIGRRHRR